MSKELNSFLLLFCFGAVDWSLLVYSTALTLYLDLFGVGKYRSHEKTISISHSRSFKVTQNYADVCVCNLSVVSLRRRVNFKCLSRTVNTIRYDSVYLTCSKNLTGSQLSLPHAEQTKN